MTLRPNWRRVLQRLCPSEKGTLKAHARTDRPRLLGRVLYGLHYRLRLRTYRGSLRKFFCVGQMM